MSQQPLKPHWHQPSHPEIQEVIINEANFSSKSISKISLPPGAVYAELSFPPCTVAPKACYSTVQFDKEKHLELNSDLLPVKVDRRKIFDTDTLNIRAGPNGLHVGEELTFFYPSTEWEMAQAFECLCGKPTCRGKISGAKDMRPEQLEGLWISKHIRQLLDDESKQVSDSK